MSDNTIYKKYCINFLLASIDKEIREILKLNNMTEEEMEKMRLKEDKILEEYKLKEVK